MGTRSLTVLTARNDGDEIAVLYRQMDGYPAGHGADLAAFLAGITLTNGISAASAGKRIANGMDCLAAQVIAHFKTNPGAFYLQRAGTRGMDEEYVYTVYQRAGKLRLRCVEVGDPGCVLYDGAPAAFVAGLPARVYSTTSTGD